MHFDVPKVVRSPGCDYGHDEESRNGRDMKIDILDDYIRTPEWFRGLSDEYRSTRGLPEPPGGLMGLMGLMWRRGRGCQGRPRAPSPPSPNWTRREGRRPPFPSSPLSLPSPLLLGLGKDGVLLPVGVGLLLVRPLLAGHPFPLAPLYTGAGRHPRHNN